MITQVPVNMETIKERAIKAVTGCVSVHFHKSFMDLGAVFFLFFSSGDVRIFSAERASLAYRVGDQVFCHHWAFKEERYVLTSIE